jgi:plasmid maintenance system killer protein
MTLSESSIEDIRVALDSISARYEIAITPPKKPSWVLRAFSDPSNIEIRDGLIPIGTLQPQQDLNQNYDFDLTWKKKLDEDIKEQGLDALAWYTSFHRKQSEWGIFIPISSLYFIADNWFENLRVTIEKKLLYAFEILYFHESFHYAIDRNIASWELAFGLPFRENTSKLLPPNKYLEIEEALANAYMLKHLLPKLPKSGQNSLINAIRNSPAGYRDAECYLDIDKYLIGAEENIKTYVMPSGLSEFQHLQPQFIHWASQFSLSPFININECPTYIIHDENKVGIPPTSLKWLQTIPFINETKKFKKQLNKLHPNLQKAWKTKKNELSFHIPPHPEFEELSGRKGIFSIRLNKSYRAHLTSKGNFEYWDALEVGTHGDMGHG